MRQLETERDADAVLQRYDRLANAPWSPFREHIHHGYWVETDDLLIAQTKLVEKLAHFVEIPRGTHVLDIGCGTGGADRWLAQNLGCSVLGISISPVEIKIATEKAQAAGLEKLLEFHVMDANQLDLPAASFDAVWVLETSEHLSGKKCFFEKCARVLKPGGRLALAMCLAAENPTPRQSRLLVTARKVLLTEPLATLSEYVTAVRAAAFEQIKTEEITSQVAETWSRISDLLRKQDRPSLSDARMRRAIVNLLAAMRAAYAAEAMRYSILSARRSTIK